MYEPILYHHGILGQSWGKRNGPPYPLRGGDYSGQEIQAIRKKRHSKNSIYNKRHFDEVLDADKTRVQTLSFDENRTKNVDMFYGVTNKLDKAVYKALLNTPIDEAGQKVYKFDIENKFTKNIKVASEDSSIRSFAELYKKDRDFYNFVTDENRMLAYFDDKRYGHKAYRDARDTIFKMKENGNYTPTYQDISKVYAMFNFIIPYTGGGNDDRGAGDVKNQRQKFFGNLKDKGYGAVLDANDSIYNKLHAASPIIVFDMENVIPDSVRRTKASDRMVGIAAISVRKSLGI